jgi:hypothetical protein
MSSICCDHTPSAPLTLLLRITSLVWCPPHSLMALLIITAPRTCLLWPLLTFLVYINWYAFLEMFTPLQLSCYIYLAHPVKQWWCRMSVLRISVDSSTNRICICIDVCVCVCVCVCVYKHVCLCVCLLSV